MTESAEIESRKHKCSRCGKSYTRRDYLERHALNHDKKAAITCERCNKRFTRIDVLRKHLKETCKGKDPYPTSPRRRRGASSSSAPPHISQSPLEYGLNATLAPFTDAVFTASSTPQPVVIRGEPSGFQDPLAIPAGWGGNTSDNMEEIFGWLFNHSDAGKSPTAVVTPRQSWNIEPPIAEPQPFRTPVDFHPLNVRTGPVSGSPEAFQLPIPLDWSLPAGREIMDSATRESILEIYDDPLRSDIDSVFTLSKMTLYVELYFLHFAPLYPIIHRASLPYRDLSTDLLVTMICIGTAYTADRESFELATRMCKRIRDRIFGRVDEEPRLDIQSLQAILQMNHFSRSYGTIKQHDVSQVFHSPSITLARLSGVYGPNYSTITATDPLARWLEWVAAEERTRCGWFAFLMDIDNAALFRHYLLIHCYAIEIPFPAYHAAWVATTPQAWQSAWHMAPQQPSFRSALRDLAGRGQIDDGCSVDVLWILLHGIISISWTLLWRDLGDLSMVGDSKITQWKASLRRAFQVWTDRAEDAAVLEPSREADRVILNAGISFAHLGTILLMTETENIRIFAGAPSIAGRPISPGEWFASSTYVNLWSRSQDAAYAVVAAMRALLRIFGAADETMSRTTPSVVAWCTYISALVVWAYSSSLEGPGKLSAHYITADKDRLVIEPSLARSHALSYLSEHLKLDHAFAITQAPDKNQCAGVIAYAAHLAGSLHRGIMDEGRVVLMGLLSEHA